MTPDQVKAARLLLGWSMSRLGMRSGTSMHTVRIFERSGQVAKLYCRTDQVDAVAAIRDTLEAAGIEFIPENDGGDGVQFRKPDQ
jgi:transcriptional regulator with XRE-family HTH domain